MLRKSVMFVFLLVLMLGTVSGVSVNIDKSGDSVDFTGTAVDNASRVELRIDDGYWNTADGVENWSYAETFDNTGSHVVEVRSIVNSSVYSTEYRTFTLDFDDSDPDSNTSVDDLSWYISVDDVVFSTIQKVGIREVDEGQDVKVSFDISNEYEEKRKLRYTISRGSWEKEDSLIVDDSDSEEVSYWIPGNQLTLGNNRFTITVDDFETHDTVVQDSFVLSVVEPSEDDTEKSESDDKPSDDEIPEWFKKVAKANNLTLNKDSSSDIENGLNELEEEVEQNDESISQLSDDVNELEASSSKAESRSDSDDEDSGYVPGVDDRIAGVVLAGIGLFAWKQGYLDRFLKEEKENQEPEQYQELQQPLEQSSNYNQK